MSALLSINLGAEVVQAAGSLRYHTSGTRAIIEATSLLTHEGAPQGFYPF